MAQFDEFKDRLRKRGFEVHVRDDVRRFERIYINPPSDSEVQVILGVVEFYADGGYQLYLEQPGIKIDDDVEAVLGAAGMKGFRQEVSA